MKPIILFTFTLCFLAGCHSAPDTPTDKPTATIFTCDQPGIVRTLTVNSVGDIGLYLPPCYNPSSEVRYPVLYLLPGFGGTDHEWFDAGLALLTDKLILSSEIPPLIIVTTGNTYEIIEPRSIVYVLIPYIESHYHTNLERTHRAIAGGSLGGAAAYVLAFQHPDLFASAGVFGNGLTTGQEAQLELWLKEIASNLKPRLFLNSGEQDTYMLQQAKALIPLLDKYGIRHTEIFSPGGHSMTYWISNFPAYYHWLTEDWR